MLQNLAMPQVKSIYDRPESPMLHTKFRGNFPNGSEDEDFLRVLPYMGWLPSRLCDQEAANKFSFPHPWRLHIKFGFDWPSCFEEEDV